MNAVELRCSPVNRQLEAYGESWKHDHDAAMACCDWEDAIAIGINIFHMLQERDHAHLALSQPEKSIVGFGSLEVIRSPYPDRTGQRTELAMIPAVAIQKPYGGKVDGPREGCYSSQILDHLIVEAARLPISVPVLGLLVHPANALAMRVYDRVGFKPFSYTFADKKTGITYLSMIRSLVVPSDV